VFLKEKTKEKQAKKILYINESQNVKKKVTNKRKVQTYQEKKHQSALSSAL
jgi:hypothetical protein